MDFETMFPLEILQALPNTDWRHWMFLEGHKAGEIRACVDRLLKFAASQGVLNAEMSARLKSVSKVQFRSALHELAIAEFLSSMGRIEWHPAGRGARVGEFELTLPENQPIFVEVKTMFESPEEQREGRNWGAIREITHKIASPFIINIEFLHLEHDVVPKRFKPWLVSEIGLLKPLLTEIGASRDLVFKDKAADDSMLEISVSLVRCSENSLPTICNHSPGGFSDLHERVKTVVDGALDQLPDNQPTLVIIANTEGVGLDEHTMTAAMFSLPKIRYRQYTEPPSIDEGNEEEAAEVYLTMQGIVQNGIRTRLSAVGLWHQYWKPEASGALDIYHNPRAAKPIPHEVLARADIYQWVRQGPDAMEWVPKRPSE